MQKAMKVEWSDWTKSHVQAVANWEELREILARLEKTPDPPPMLLIYEEDTGRELGVGLGRDRTVVTYQDSVHPPYFMSLGNRDEQGVEWFCHGQERTEYLARNLVPRAVAMPTVKAFLLNPGRPNTIDWEQL